MDIFHSKSCKSNMQFTIGAFDLFLTPAAYKSVELNFYIVFFLKRKIEAVSMLAFSQTAHILQVFS